MINKFKNNKSGFTLLEVTFVVVIIGIIAAISIPRFGGTATNAKEVEIQAKRVVAHLRLARHLAISQNLTYYLYIDAADDTYAIYETAVLSINQVTEDFDIDDRLTLTGDVTFAFEPNGNVLSGAGTSAVFSNGVTDWTVSITPATGRITRERTNG